MQVCKDCGQSFEKLYAPKKGQCRRCYKNEWEKNARKDPVLGAKIRARQKKVYENNKDNAKESMKRYRERKHFDSKRQRVLEENNYTCTKCGAQPEEKNLIVHHEDRQGRGSSKPNNEDQNLTLLCRSCHAREHAIELAIARGADATEAKGFEWSLKYQACIECGTTETKHKARGKCNNCYKRERDRIKREQKI